MADNFSLESRRIKEGAYDDFDNPYSHNPQKDESFNVEAWSEFLGYYRYYIDEFAVNILGLELPPFQRLILRSMGRYQESMFIACRGLGRLYLAVSL